MKWNPGMKWNGINEVNGVDEMESGNGMESGVYDLAAAVQIHISVRRKSILRDELDIPHCPSHTTSGMSDFHLVLDQCDNPVVAPTKHKSAVGGWAVIGDILPDVDFLGLDFGRFGGADDGEQSISQIACRKRVVHI